MSFFLMKNQKAFFFEKKNKKSNSLASRTKKAADSPKSRDCRRESCRSRRRRRQKKKKKKKKKIKKRKKIKMKKGRAHIASTILGLEYEEEENGKVCYLNSDAKDKIDFRAYKP